MSPRFETPIFYYRPYPGNPIADEAQRGATCFREGCRHGRTSTTSAIAARGSAPTAGGSVERFKFYTRHAWQESGKWRWPLRTAAALALRSRLVRVPV